jgi:hypothetical protein
MAQLLNEAQVRQAVEAMRACLAAPRGTDGLTFLETQSAHEQKRAAVIETELQPLLREYQAGRIDLATFKTRIDGINKENHLWGFRGIKGQLFFNLVVKAAEDRAECDRELKQAIAAPPNEEAASRQIGTFASYVNRVGEAHVRGGGKKGSRPNVGSIPYFLSYFWQVQARDIWPMFFTNSVNVMTDMNLWQPTGEPAADYIAFKHIHEELAQAFNRESGHRFGLYAVETVFWWKGGNPLVSRKPPDKGETGDRSGRSSEPPDIFRLPESYVPPIVAILPRMARNEEALREGAKAAGTSLDRVFEKSINAAFTVLGYETKLLGQGQGRVPDGLAVELGSRYAILWDAKARSDGYSMGTDDRTIKEYINSQSRELKGQRGIRNIYYLIVSSGFADDFDDTIRSIKMETDVSEVCLVEAEALVRLVEAKMRAPLQVTLGPDGFQRLFAGGGVLSAATVKAFW